MTRTNATPAQGSGGGEAWTTRRLLAWMSEAFTKAGLDSPRLQAEMLLAHVIGCQRLRLFTDPERNATGVEREALRALVGRALRHEPIDYLVGQRSFFGMMFKVDSRALVPRPSTETLVEFVLQEARRQGQGAAGDETAAIEAADDRNPAAIVGGRGVDPGERVFSVEEGAATLSAFRPSQDDLEEDDEAELDRPAPPKRAAAAPLRAPAPLRTPVTKKARAAGPAWRIADVGTGTGCIAIALARNLPRSAVVATDVSTDALDLAIENAARHAVGDRIEFRHGHLLEPLSGDRFDLIVSNPPYIPDEEWGEVPANVKGHEPHLALRGGADGLELVRPLVAGAPGLLNPGGWLVLETASSRAGQTAELARAAGFAEVRTLKDIDGLDRVVVGRTPT